MKFVWSWQIVGWLEAKDPQKISAQFSSVQFNSVESIEA